MAEGLVAQLYEALAENLPWLDIVMVGDGDWLYFVSYKHIQIHALVRFRVIKDPHDDIHNLGLYGCEKIISGEFVMLVLFH